MSSICFTKGIQGRFRLPSIIHLNYLRNSGDGAVVEVGEPGARVIPVSRNHYAELKARLGLHRKIRAHTKLLVSLGDCAVNSNVPCMRNPFGVEACTARAYLENVTAQPQVPDKVIPPLLPQARPVHEFVKVDVFIPGCPPSADTIYYALAELLAGRSPDLADKTRFGS